MTRECFRKLGLVKAFYDDFFVLYVSKVAKESYRVVYFKQTKTYVVFADSESMFVKTYLFKTRKIDDLVERLREIKQDIAVGDERWKYHS